MPFFYQEETPADQQSHFKNLILGKLNDNAFPFRLETHLNQGHRQDYALNRRRINTDLCIRKKLILPELENRKRGGDLRQAAGELRVESKRMLDRVNQLYCTIFTN